MRRINVNFDGVSVHWCQECNMAHKGLCENFKNHTRRRITR